MKLNYCKQTPNARDLKLATPGSAGYDLFTDTDDIVLQPNEIKVISTGLSLEIPSGYYGQIASRSGLAAKHGVHTLAGVIDSDYRGPVGVILRNSGTEPFKISRDQAIAQIIFLPIYTECNLLK